ncbi:hypothetical protein KR018_002221 [Drosophila ironensis]|nr:hypothetical protein KR018_002221 [Drosophila ironensis]
MKRLREDEKNEGDRQTPDQQPASSGIITPDTPGSSALPASPFAATASSVRTTGRVKKPKQVYDPSDNYISRASNRNSLAGSGAVGAGASGSPTAAAAPADAQSPPPPAQPPKEAAGDEAAAGDDPACPVPAEPVAPKPQPQPPAEKEQPPQSGPATASNRNVDTCKKCGKSEPKRGSGNKSNFLTCKSCMQKWHFPCLRTKFENQSLARKKYKCEKCRYCQKCNARGRDLAICSQCVEAYHTNCHSPPLQKSIKLPEIRLKWRCSQCDANYVENNCNATANAELVPKKSNAGRKKRALSDPVKMPKPEKQPKFEVKKEHPKEVERLDVKAEEPEVIEMTADIKKEEQQEVLIVSLEKSDISQEPQGEQMEEPEKPAIPALKSEPEEQSQPQEVQPQVEEVKPQPPSPKAETQVITIDDEEDNPPEYESDSPTVAEENPVKSWTVDQVVDFVAKEYPIEASAFRRQEIDGASLLLLSRTDLLRGFGLRLGRALRVYELVMALQSMSDDVRLCWH